MAKILVVEDEKVSQAMILSSLSDHEVMMTDTFSEAIEWLNEHSFDLAILDILLPSQETGLDICSYIRGHEHTKQMEVLILSVKGSEIEKIHGLEIGADDYITKPFSAHELKARVQAMLRRSSQGHHTFRTGFIELDYQNLQAFTLGKTEKTNLLLTPIEFRVLNLLIHHPNRIYSNEEMILGVGATEKLTENSLSVHVSSLRKKVAGFAAIERVQKEGYFLKLLFSKAA